MLSRFMFILLLSYSPFSFALTPGKDVRLSVPFQTITLNPNDVITADYSFGDHPLIFCFDTTTATIGQINWFFQGSPKSSSIPVFLKNRDGFDGEFADPNGLITITNTSAKQMFVSCQLGF